MRTAERDVRDAQIAAIYAQIPLAVTVTMANALVLVAVLVASAADSAPLALSWLATVAAIAAWRLLIRRRQRRDAASGSWGLLAAASSALAGLAWGGGLALLWPEAEVVRLFWVFVVGGMCAGAAALQYAHLPSAAAFILAASLPVALRFALDGDAPGLGAAAMIMVFAAALLNVSAKANAHWRDVALLRLDLGRREAELAAARAALLQEAAEHRATTENLHHAQKLDALGQLTGGIAHDFNNLLMVVLSSLELLRKRLPTDDPRAARLLDNAVQGADRGAALTQRLLAFGRRQTLRPTSVALAPLLKGMEELLRRSISPSHRIDFRLPERLPPVLIDPNQLELAVVNLVLNARDAMPAGGDIVIAAHLAPDGCVVLSVDDHGEGMDAATLARATEPFFTTKEAGKGTGLGLSMVHGLAAQSGGRLVLHSSPGEGTTAELWLPLAETAASPSGEPEARRAPAAARRLTVLVVDDDPLVLTSASAMLEDLGHAAIEAADGPAALARLRDSAVDVVLTDYGMPGMTGAALAAEIARLRPGLPVILATGYDDVPGETMHGMAALPKPFDQQALARRIEAAFRAPA